ncbi:MAG TPA: aminoglycoside phosphotransferase family protein [Candidatus Angelobacter sp.]|nr:aminoglycoside phosphotransferase family protein [Candidatus Angelobacter sp.]
MFQIPPALDWLQGSTEGRTWLQDLPVRVKACVDQWQLSLEVPYQRSFVSIVFPATSADGSPRVLKIQYAHPESDHEEEALRLWNGKGAVRLFDYDPGQHALLLERCEPGDHLSRAGAEEALRFFTATLPRLWVSAGKPFRSVMDEASGWLAELPLVWERAGRPFEPALLEAALEALDTLRSTQGEQVLVHQDLHGDNVLRATREPWLVIDPKPLVGEREFSLAPIIRDYDFGHSRDAVISRLDRLTAALGLNRERARLWAMGQTLAWASDGSKTSKEHVETARWLWQA